MELGRQSDPKNKEQACCLAGMALMACKSMQLDRAGRYAHVVNIWDLLSALSTGSATRVLYCQRKHARAPTYVQWADSLCAPFIGGCIGQGYARRMRHAYYSDRFHKASTTPEMYLAPRAVRWQAMDDPMMPAPITTTCGPVALAILRSSLTKLRHVRESTLCTVRGELPA